MLALAGPIVLTGLVARELDASDRGWPTLLPVALPALAIEFALALAAFAPLAVVFRRSLRDAPNLDDLFHGPRQLPLNSDTG